MLTSMVLLRFHGPYFDHESSFIDRVKFMVSVDNGKSCVKEESLTKNLNRITKKKKVYPKEDRDGRPSSSLLSL